MGRGSWHVPRRGARGVRAGPVRPPSSALAPPGPHHAPAAGPAALPPSSCGAKGGDGEPQNLSLWFRGNPQLTLPMARLSRLRPLTPSSTASRPSVPSGSTATPSPMHPHGARRSPVPQISTLENPPSSPQTQEWHSAPSFPTSPGQVGLGDPRPRTGATQESGGFQPRQPFHT